MKIRKKVTVAKMAANRNNARNSKGPTSIRGKWFASQNAITHGLFSRDMLLPGESEKEFKRLHNEMINCRCPFDFCESLKVEKLAWHEWRNKRLYRAETAAAAKLLAEHDPAAEFVARSHSPQLQQASAALKQLDKIEEQIIREGRVSNEHQEWLQTLPYGDVVKDFLAAIEITQPTEFGEEVRASAETPVAAEKRGPTPAANASTSEAVQDLHRTLLLNMLNDLKGFIQREQVYHGQSLLQRSVATRNLLLVPPEAELDRLIRYENHIARKIACDENALERMQRLRRGEKVPPPTARAN